MLDDKRTAEVEAYLVHRDKDFKLRQERAIRDHVDSVLGKRASERRAWASFAFGIGGTTLAGMIFFAWQSALGVVESRIDSAIEKQEQRFSSWENEANQLRAKLLLANDRFENKEKQLTALQIEADALGSKLSAFETIPETKALANENHKSIAIVKFEIDELKERLNQLKLEIIRAVDSNFRRRI